MKRGMRLLLPALLASGILLGIQAASGATFSPVLIKSGLTSTGSSGPFELVPLAGRLLFQESDGTHGTELWSTDGTTAGTGMVKDLLPGSASSEPGGFIPIGNIAFFLAQDASHIVHPWKTDGTAAGTSQLSSVSVVQEIGGAGSTFYFAGDDGTHGSELWKTNGTSAGTTMVKDIAPGSADGVTDDVGAALNGNLLFFANDGVHGDELWKSDGTAAGTSMVADICPGSCSSGPSTSFMTIGSTVYFAADDGVHGAELWKTDGTAAGTVLVKDIDPGSAGSQPSRLTDVDGTLFFAADDGTGHGRQLWKSDGTSAGTSLVANVTGGSIWTITPVGAEVFFGSPSGLWESDGTGPGTTLVSNVAPDVDNMIAFGGELVYSAYDDSSGDELWQSDGTPAGTFMTADLDAGPGDGDPAHFAILADRLFFFTDDDGTEVSLWELTQPPPPSISSFTPRGFIGTDVTITGSGLEGASAVSFGGTPAASFDVDSATQITAVVAPGTRSGTITVTTPGGTTSSSRPFVVAAPPPSIRSFTPLHGAAGTNVTIVGTGFSSATRVAFDGTPALTFIAVSDSEIAVTVPAGATTGRVTVATPNGTASSTSLFAVPAAPSVTGLTPSTARRGMTVLILGSGFTGATGVAFHGTSATFAVVSDRVIRALVPHTATTGTVAVTGPGGTGTSSTAFTVAP